MIAPWWRHRRRRAAAPVDRDSPDGPGTAAARPPSLRLLGTLATGGALAGLLIVLVYQWTLPAIEHNRAVRLEAAIQEVLPGIERFETLYLLQGRLYHELPADTDPRGLERVYLGVGAGGEHVGYALPAGEAGFMDVIELIFGYQPETGTVLGMKILDSKETPGLGDKIEKDQSFVGQFRGARVPLIEVKPGARRAPDEVELITGATISARTVIGSINNALERWAPLIDAHRAGTSP